MKLIIIVGIIAVIVGGILLFKPQTISVTQPEPVTIEKEVVVEEIGKRIKDAQTAHEADITSKAQAAYDEAFKQGMLDVEIDVRKQYQIENDAALKELQKQSQSY